MRSAPHASTRAGAAIQRLINAHDHLTSHHDDARLLGSHLKPAPELAQQILLGIGQTGWQQRKRRLLLDGTLGFSAMADTTTLGVIAQLNGKRTLVEAATIHAQQIGVDAERPVGGLAAAARELLRLGMLVPA